MNEMENAQEKTFLPADTRDRIKDLLKDKGVTQNELAERIGLSAGSLSRYLSGKTEKLGDGYIIKMAKELDVSTDFLLGETQIPERRNYDIEELGLSAGAVRLMVENGLDMAALNVLLEHPLFPELLTLLARYQDGSLAEGIRVQNMYYDLLTGFARDHARFHARDRHALKKFTEDLNACKVNPSSVDTHAVIDLFTEIVGDLKENAVSAAANTEPVTKELLEQFKKKVKGKSKVLDLRKLTPEWISKSAISVVLDNVEVSEEARKDLEESITRFYESCIVNDDNGRAM